MIPHPDDTDDETSAKLGEALVKVLQLRPDPEHKGRYQTTCGSKTTIGIYRTVCGILEKPDHYTK